MRIEIKLAGKNRDGKKIINHRISYWILAALRLEGGMR